MGASRQHGSSTPDCPTGLELRQRGAGLVIGKAGEPALMMKASDLDRSMGYGRLVERFGAFVPATEAARASATTR